MKKLSTSGKLYLISALIIIIATMTAIIGRMAFEPLYSKVIIWLSGGLVVSGKLISTIRKGKRNRNLAKDVGIIVGIAVALLYYFQM